MVAIELLILNLLVVLLSGIILVLSIRLLRLDPKHGSGELAKFLRQQKIRNLEKELFGRTKQ